MAYIKVTQKDKNINNDTSECYINSNKIVSVRCNLYSRIKFTEIDCVNGKSYQCLESVEYILSQIGNFK